VSNYNPNYLISYGFSKINLEITKILNALNDKLSNKLRIDKNEKYLLFSYNSLYKPDESSYLPYMSNAEEVKIAVNGIKVFFKNEANALLIKFENLAEVDKIWNGTKPLEDDGHKPFTSGGNFNIKRLIVSKLSNPNDYSRIYDFVLRHLESKFNDKYGQGFKEEHEQVMVLNDILKD
jgi:hypothetical protein